MAKDAKKASDEADAVFLACKDAACTALGIHRQTIMTRVKDQCMKKIAQAGVYIDKTRNERAFTRARHQMWQLYHPDKNPAGASTFTMLTPLFDFLVACLSRPRRAYRSAATAAAASQPAAKRRRTKKGEAPADGEEEEEDEEGGDDGYGDGGDADEDAEPVAEPTHIDELDLPAFEAILKHSQSVRNTVFSSPEFLERAKAGLARAREAHGSRDGAARHGPFGGGDMFAPPPPAMPETARVTVQLTPAQLHAGCELPLTYDVAIVTTDPTKSVHESHTHTVVVPPRCPLGVHSIVPGAGNELRLADGTVHKSALEISVAAKLPKDYAVDRFGNLVYTSRVSLYEGICGPSFVLTDIFDGATPLSVNFEYTRPSKTGFSICFPRRGLYRALSTGAVGRTDLVVNTLMSNKGAVHPSVHFKGCDRLNSVQARILRELRSGTGIAMPTASAR